MWPGSPIGVVLRMRLRAITAITVHALLAANAPAEVQERSVLDVTDGELDHGVAGGARPRRS
jgi:hypothetical protein